MEPVGVVAVGLALAFGGHRVIGRGLDPPFARVAAGAGRDPDDPGLAWEMVESDATKLLAAGLLVAFVLVVEGRGVGSLTGRRLRPLLFVVAVAGGLAVMLGQNVVTQPLYDRLGVGGDVEGELADLGSLSLGQRLVVALVAGVTEEVLFRGYPVERLVELTGSPLLAGGVSTLAFGLAHYGFWDRGSTVQITVTGGVLTGIYLVTRSLPVVIAVHALNDAVGLVIAARIDGGDDDPGDPDADDPGDSDTDDPGGQVGDGSGGPDAGDGGAAADDDPDAASGDPARSRQK